MDITLLSTSDTHGYLYPTDFRQKHQSLNYGLTKVKAQINKIKEHASGPVICIDNGDFIQGSPLSYYVAKMTDDYSMADVMNEVGYDVGVLGNHEFNYGIDYLEETISKLNYPVVCANILKENGDYLTGYPYIVLERQGIKVAILGLTTQYIPHWEQPETVNGLVFKSAFETAKQFVPKLKELADVVVVSYHGGFEKDLLTGEPTEVLTGENEGYDLLHHVEGIDVLLTGHQHRVIEFNEGNMPVTQPGDKGRYLGEVVVSYSANKIESKQAKLIAINGNAEDMNLKHSFLPLLNDVETWLDKELGRVQGSMSIHDPMTARVKGHPYVEFIQDVQKAATGATISGTALFDNDGKGFGETISMRDIVTNYIYPNTLAVVRVTGAELKEALERCASYFDISEDNRLVVSKEFLDPKVEHYNYDMYSGIEYDFDISKCKGQRVTSLSLKGQPILPDETLDIVMNQYRAVGGGDYSMFGPDKIIKEVTVDMTELISDYLQKNPVIQAKQPTNFNVRY
ncbi:MAG: bifunctional metallophosphatase/5'-nucleotidase [Vagococcus sp.]